MFKAVLNRDTMKLAALGACGLVFLLSFMLFGLKFPSLDCSYSYAVQTTGIQTDGPFDVSFESG